METWWWDALPVSVRERVDEFVLSDRRLQAIQAVMEAVRGQWEGVQAPRPGLHECDRVVMARYQALADRIVRRPEPPRDAESLAARIGELPGRLVAVEAIWDGDTSGWFVVLVAVLDGPPSEVDLAMIRHGSDLRVFNGQVPPWPEAVEAQTTGTALAARFGVPFHFASPDAPDDEAPRWRPTP
ncbi:hypothetical protein ABZ825_14260 [Streptomyces tauricus]|uniref:hypothetical protein n=1 Tax=Streptomyces tauricus TaxID=68274 RepID=UPI001677C49F|nr:hypothetical protein [Streptomyces tauricus]